MMFAVSLFGENHFKKLLNRSGPCSSIDCLGFPLVFLNFVNIIFSSSPYDPLARGIVEDPLPYRSG